MPFEISKQLLLPHVLCGVKTAAVKTAVKTAVQTAVKQQQLCMHWRPWWHAPKCVLASKAEPPVSTSCMAVCAACTSTAV